MSSLGDRLARARAAASADTTEPADTTSTDAPIDAAGDAPSHPTTEVTTGGQHAAATPGAPASPTPSSATAAPAVPVPSHASAVTAPSVSAPGKRRADSPTSRRRAHAVSAHHDRIEELKGNVHSELLRELGPQLYDANMDQAELEKRVRQVLKDVLGAHEKPLSAADRARVTLEITDDILGYGPIEPLLRDPDVTEIMINGPESVWIEKQGRISASSVRFTDEPHLRRTIDKIVSRVGRRVDEASPMVDARLPDGSRINAVIPPLAIDGSALTIRKFAADPLTAADLVTFGTLSPAACDFLDACVRGRLNIIVSGSTGAGKTTTLNVLSGFIPSDERIVTIEDAAELQLHQEHVVRLESRPANIEGRGAVEIRDLVKNSLRMRPDRIIVGEVRDASALDMLQAMNTGHDGSICSVHSNGPRDTVSRIETMVLMAGMDLPIRAIREQVASAVDLIVHQTRFKDGTRHVTSITEVERMEGDVITLQDIFVFDYSAGHDAEGRNRGRLVSTGLRPSFLDKMANSNVRVDPALFQSGVL